MFFSEEEFLSCYSPALEVPKVLLFLELDIVKN